jgi:Fic family protein
MPHPCARRWHGRIARAIADLALAQAWPPTARLHAMSAAILANRSGYYDILETTQRGPLDITAWLRWFLETLLHSLHTSQQRIDRVLAQASRV